MIDDDEHAARMTELTDTYLRECVRVAPEDMTREFVQLPGLLAYWNQRYAVAHKAYLDAKLDATVTRARLQPLVRDALAMAGGRVTEAVVEAAIDANEDYIAAVRALNAADAMKSEMFGVVDTIRAKREMLVSLGATIRAEMQHDPVTREYSRAGRAER